MGAQMRAQDIAEAAKRAGAILARVRQLPGEQRTAENLLPLLRQAVECKLMIGEQEESNLRNLAVISIKLSDQRAGSLSDEAVLKQIKKYDCHQTSLVTQKKVLLLMYLERELRIHMSDEDASSIETLEDLARLTAAYLKEGG